MTKLAAMPIYGKKLKKSFLRNQKIDDLETWYATSGARVLPSLFKWWTWVDCHLFYGKAKCGSYAFVLEKGNTMDFLETIVVYDLKQATDDRSDKTFLLTLKLCPLGLSAPDLQLYTFIKSWKDVYQVRGWRDSV